MQILKTIQTNWRDLVVGITLTVGLSFIADSIERLATLSDGKVWLVNVVTSLRGLATFAGVNLAAFFMVAVAWPTLNAHSNDHFASGWDSLTQQTKFLVFITVSMSYLIAAALCFAK